MRYPEARVAEVCELGPVEAARLLDRGRAGDLQALADWSVRAVYKKMIRGGASPAEALHHTKVVLDAVDLKVALTS